MRLNRTPDATHQSGGEMVAHRVKTLEEEAPAMAVRSQEMRNTTARTRTVQTRPLIATPSISLHSIAYIATGVLALIAIYAIMGNVLTWGRGHIDDLRYGTTRTFHLDAVVGHEDGAGTPTHFV